MAANRGSQALSRKVEKHGSKTALAKEMGKKVDVAMVGRWASGERKPDTQNRLWLQRNRRIPPTWWDEQIEDEQDAPSAA